MTDMFYYDKDIRAWEKSSDEERKFYDDNWPRFTELYSCVEHVEGFRLLNVTSHRANEWQISPWILVVNLGSKTCWFLCEDALEIFSVFDLISNYKNFPKM